MFKLSDLHFKSQTKRKYGDCNDEDSYRIILCRKNNTSIMNFGNIEKNRFYIICLQKNTILIHKYLAATAVGGVV